MPSALEQEDTFVIPEASEAELQRAIEYAAKFYLGISADEFMRRWTAHELCEEDPQVENVLYVINFIRSGRGEAKL